MNYWSETFHPALANSLFWPWMIPPSVCFCPGIGRREFRRCPFSLGLSSETANETVALGGHFSNADSCPSRWEPQTAVVCFISSGSLSFVTIKCRFATSLLLGHICSKIICRLVQYPQRTILCVICPTHPSTHPGSSLHPSWDKFIQACSHPASPFLCFLAWTGHTHSIPSLTTTWRDWLMYEPCQPPLLSHAAYRNYRNYCKVLDDEEAKRMLNRKNRHLVRQGSRRQMEFVENSISFLWNFQVL